MLYKGYDVKAVAYIKGQNGNDLVMDYDQWTKWALENQGSFGYIKLEKTTEKENTDTGNPVKAESSKADSTLVEYNGNFSSTAEVRGYVLDNRDEYEGYIVRSGNCWDGDTIYRWQELDKGRIIWRKTKA